MPAFDPTKTGLDSRRHAEGRRAAEKGVAEFATLSAPAGPLSGDRVVTEPTLPTDRVVTPAPTVPAPTVPAPTMPARSAQYFAENFIGSCFTAQMLAENTLNLHQLLKANVNTKEERANLYEFLSRYIPREETRLEAHRSHDVSGIEFKYEALNFIKRLRDWAKTDNSWPTMKGLMEPPVRFYLSEADALGRMNTPHFDPEISPKLRKSGSTL